jgi:hypothetical protein
MLHCTISLETRDAMGLIAIVQRSIKSRPDAPAVVSQKRTAIMAADKSINAPVAAKAPAPIAQTTAAPVAAQIAAPVVEKTAAPIGEKTAAPVVEKTAPVVEETAAPVVKKTAPPVVKKVAAPVAKKVAAPVAKTVAAVAAKTVVAAAAKKTAAPVVKTAAVPVAKKSIAPVVKKAVMPVATAKVFEKAATKLKQGVETVTTAGATASAKALKTAKDVVALNQGAAAALTQSSQIWAAGSQDLLRDMARSGQNSFTETVASFRALATAKTPKEQFDLQMGLLRTSTLWALSESSRFARAGLDLATKAAAPLTAHAALAAEAIGVAKV